MVRQPWKLLLRGIGVGALTIACWLVVMGVGLGRTTPSSPYLLLAVVYELPLGAALGGAVSLVVLALRRVLRRNIGILLRSLIGFLCAFFGYWIRTSGGGITWQTELFYGATFGLLVGTITAILIGSQD